MGPVSWEEYVTGMLMMFDAGDLQRPIAQLKRLREVDIYYEYVDEFVSLVSRVELAEDDQVAMFIEGMKGGNKKLVTALNPRNLQHAIALGKTLSLEDDPYSIESKRGDCGNRTGGSHGNKGWLNSVPIRGTQSEPPQGKPMGSLKPQTTVTSKTTAY